MRAYSIIFIKIVLLLSSALTCSAFIINSFNDTSNSFPLSGLADTARVISLEDSSTLTALVISCNTTLASHQYSPNSTLCLIWLSDVIRMPKVYDFPVTLLLDGEVSSLLGGLADNSISVSSRLAFIPLLGPVGHSLCPHRNWYTTFPCAVLVMDTVRPQVAWLADTWNIETNITSKPRSTLPSPLPFNCSEELPCALRTSESQNGTAGGCYRGSSPSTGTLVVVTWNQTRYFFRPLSFFNGQVKIYSVPSRATEWLPFDSYDASLQFHGIISSSSTTNVSTSCAMHLIGSDGSTSMYDTEIEDESSPTGLLLIASVAPPQGLSEGGNCYPYLQHLSLPLYDSSSNNESSSAASVGTLLSVTCADGRGWLWNLLNDSTAPISTTSTSLVGAYTVPLPTANVSQGISRPLIADISIVALYSPCDNSSIDQITGQPILSYVTKIAIVGLGLFEDTSWVGGGGANLSFATFAGNSSNLTQRLVNTALTNSQLSVSGIPQRFLHGLGWIAADGQPLIVTLPYSSPWCDGNTRQMVDWYCLYGILDSAVTEQFSVLINSTDGTVAAQQLVMTITGNHDTGSPSPYIVSGGLFAWPAKLPSVSSNSSMLSFRRIQSSPTFSLQARAGEMASALVQTSRGTTESMIHFHTLSLPPRLVLSAQITYVDDSRVTISGGGGRPWALESSVWNIFTPTPFTVVESCPPISQGASNTLFPVMWAGSGALAIAQYQAPNESSSSGSSYLAIYTSVAAATSSQSVPYGLGADMDHNNPNNSPLYQPPLSLLVQDSIVFVCDGDTVIGSTSGVANVVLTCQDLCDPPSARCYCSPEHQIFLATDGTTNTGATMVFVTMFYPDVNATALVILDFQLNIVGHSSDLVSKGLPTGCVPLDSSISPPKVFGDLVDVTSILGAIAVVTPITGTQCMLLAVSMKNNFVFVYFVQLEGTPSYQPSIGLEGSYIILSTAPVLSDTDQPNATYVGMVYAFDANVLWSTVMVNIKRYDQLVGAGGVFQLGAYPSSKWPASAFAHAGGLLICAEIANMTTSFDYGMGVRFNVFNIATGDPLFASGTWLFLPNVDVTKEIFGRMSMFTTSQLDMLKTQGLVYMACLTAGDLICIDDISTAQYVPSQYACGQQCWGAPLIVQKPLPYSFITQISMLWIYEGRMPYARIMSSFGSVPSTKVQGDQSQPIDHWSGLVWGPETMRGGLNLSQATINQTSCRDPFVSNQGLFLKCAMVAEPQVLRLLVVDVASGTILLASGPQLSPRPRTVALSSDWNTFIYIDDIRRSVSALQLDSYNAQAQSMPFLNVCANDEKATYVLSFSVGTFAGTMTPYETTAFPSFIQTTEVYPSTSSFTLPTSIPSLQVGNPGFSIGETIVYGEDLVDALSDTLYPPLVDVGKVTILSTAPSSVTTESTSLPLMTLQQCDNCKLNCPVFCVLQIYTGVQFEYTSQVTTLSAIAKPYGETHFDPKNSSEVLISYTGNVSLNVLRFLYQSRTEIQAVLCQADAATTLVQPARYCLQSGTSWSVVGFDAYSSSYATTFRQTKAGGYTSTGYVKAKYNAFAATFGGNLVFSVSGELGMAQFLTSCIYSLPTDRLANAEITSVSTIVQVLNGSMSGQTLTIVTNAGNLTYSQEACKAENLAIPMCATDFIPFVADMVDTRYQTVQWEGLPSSSWGSGFVASGYEAHLDNLLREPLAGQVVPCGTSYNINCDVVCQPSGTCGSVFHSIVVEYLYIKSFYPAGTTLTYLPSDYPMCTDLATLTTTNQYLSFPIRMYPASATSVIITVSLSGKEFVVATSDDPLVEYFGATFYCSHCQFYMLPEIVAQPFGWLAINAVKTLFLTLLFYFVEHRMRNRERRRSVVQGYVAALKYDIAEMKAQRRQEILGFAGEGGQEDAPSVDGRKAAHGAKISELEAELAREEDIEKATHLCGGCIPNLLDKTLSMLTTLCGVRPVGARASFSRQIRQNLLSSEVGSDALVALLFGVLRESPEHFEFVRKFADFYQLALCNGMCWVIKAEPSMNADIKCLESEYQAQIEEGHGRLKEVFEVYLKSVWLQSLGPHLLMKLVTDEVPHPSQQLRDQPASSNVNATTDNNSRRSSANNGSRYSPTESEPLVDKSRNAADEGPQMGSSSIACSLRQSVETFNKLHYDLPNCFEYAILPCRQTDAKLQPSIILLGLSIIQSIITMMAYAVDVYFRSQRTPLSSLQLYECIYFMVFNSSMPSSLLVNSVYHRYFQPSSTASNSFISKTLFILRGPFVITTLLLFSPAIPTHIFPGFVLYIWVTGPLVGIPIGIDYYLRNGHAVTRMPPKVLIALRMSTRVAILFFVSIALSISFNAADAYLWQQPYLSGEDAKWFATGSYMERNYFGSLAQDYNSRSISCVWEHLFRTISNFLQMGFFFV